MSGLVIFYASDFTQYTQLKVFNHENVRYGCSKCKKTYQQKKTLGRHLRFDCGQKPAFTCQLCAKQFKHGYILLKHMRNTHDIFIQKLRQRGPKIVSTVTVSSGSSTTIQVKEEDNDD
ncbi:hypothetical protein GWI33_014861 [Rhynchophorus ferrugineus]|uniref:C2H2-type domain-containing protein n=1 Tax=Rhynchophorus ferrugineus TaxID=354439 RepID=A0A834I0I2_RHYFE|nr:hypothetical protein GWI33_014861 [Rhynchophorus ferrugineus]